MHAKKMHGWITWLERVLKACADGMPENLSHSYCLTLQMPHSGICISSNSRSGKGQTGTWWMYFSLLTNWSWSQQQRWMIDIVQGSGHNKVTCIKVWTPNATKVMMGKIGDQTPDECMCWFKNELLHGTTGRPTKWMPDRQSFRFWDPCSISNGTIRSMFHSDACLFQWIHVLINRSMFCAQHNH